VPKWSTNFEETLSRALGRSEEQDKVLECSIIIINYSSVIINACYNYVINALYNYYTVIPRLTSDPVNEFFG